MLMPTVLHPKSIGFLELASSDPYEQPMIQPNYLTHPEDKDTLVRGAEELRCPNSILNDISNCFQGCNFVTGWHRQRQCRPTG